MNTITIICPYKYEGLWVFDDAAVGLIREPFVAGADHMIDEVTASIPKAEDGFKMMFSATPFPTHQYKLDLVGASDGGHVYQMQLTENKAMTGWLCPALLKYFDEAPEHIYVQISAR